MLIDLQYLHVFHLHFDLCATREGVPYLERSSDRRSVVIYPGLGSWAHAACTSERVLRSKTYIYSLVHLLLNMAYSISCRQEYPDHGRGSIL